MDYARLERRAVLTQDLDFSTLLALSGLDQPSLVTLRVSETHPHKIAETLLRAAPVLEENLAEGCAITIEDQAIRIRKLPIR